MSAGGLAGLAWVLTHDGDPLAFDLFSRHYTYRARAGRPRARFVGPGERLVLRTPEYDALFVWLAERFRLDGQRGILCAVFRNEGHRLSSRLILDAEAFAWAKWPGERLYTYIDPARVRSANPGACFQAAGWRRCGRSKARGLIRLEKCT